MRLLPLPRRVELLLAAFDDVGRCADAVGQRDRGRHRSGRPRDDGRTGDPRGRGFRPLRLPAGCRRRCCSARSMDSPADVDDELGRARARARGRRRDERARRRATPTSADACGRDASPRSRRSAAWRRTTTAWTAPSRAGTWPAVLARIATLSRELSARRGQRLPRGRRQPAPADPVRRRPGRTNWHAPSASAPTILEACVAAGGTVTGEHGVGVEKLGPMCSQFGAAELAGLPCAEARVRSRRPAQSRQGRADARPLRRLWRAARARRPAAASRTCRGSEPCALIETPPDQDLTDGAGRARARGTTLRARRCGSSAATPSVSTVGRCTGRTLALGRPSRRRALTTRPNSC